MDNNMRFDAKSKQTITSAAIATYKTPEMQQLVDARHWSSKFLVRGHTGEHGDWIEAVVDSPTFPEVISQFKKAFKPDPFHESMTWVVGVFDKSGVQMSPGFARIIFHIAKRLGYEPKAPTWLSMRAIVEHQVCPSDCPDCVIGWRERLKKSRALDRAFEIFMKA